MTFKDEAIQQAWYKFVARLPTGSSPTRSILEAFEFAWLDGREKFRKNAELVHRALCTPGGPDARLSEIDDPERRAFTTCCSMRAADFADHPLQALEVLADRTAEDLTDEQIDVIRGWGGHVQVVLVFGPRKETT